MNRLQHEQSPYLLQHADNPVDWYPWGEEAFEKARTEDKPIFLSIGYSTCHWCHVMEHESFEDPRVAALMNEAFVSVKVDREERPDLDAVYMSAAQLLTGQGGWPLTIVMTPDGRPFFAATYIPKTSRYGRLGMVELIPRIQEIWQNRRGEIDRSGQQVVQALRQIDGAYSSGGALGAPALDQAFRALEAEFDESNGGFGGRPKFPTPHNLIFLLRYWKRTGSREALAMVETTLEAMRRGGIYDQVGFGFHRYSTDSRWLVPHFEKMLYDQAMLAMAYTEAYQATGKELYARTAREVLTYVLQDLRAPEGGFYSAEDADSEGEEGKFYLWTFAELESVLSPEQVEELTAITSVEKGGNYREEAGGEQTGANILALRDGASSLPAAVRDKLLAARGARVRPLRDDKILTGWNGLMIAALARAAAVLDEPDYREAAAGAAQFLLTRLLDAQGRLLHRYRGGEAAIRAYADDYAYLIWGLAELYEATFESQYLSEAFRLMDELVERYWDDREEGGGFFQTADEAEELLVRSRSFVDSALPSGNSVALLALLRLGAIGERPEYEERAERLASLYAAQVGRAPGAFGFALSAADFLLGPAYEVVIAGRSEAPDTRQIARALRREYLPSRVLLLRPTDEPEPPILKLAPFLQDYRDLDGRAAIYVCRDRACRLPTTELSTALEVLSPAPL
ncbi:MAG: thioredoxin domain-containing protein [Spirochaetales bacterium]|nr:thioredoxin domain-containing protein [Spirochaetales bacterium]